MRKSLPVIAFLVSLSNMALSHTLSFPQGFKWCVATSAHQVEGDNTGSDWWAWEHLPPICDSNGKCECKIKNCESSGRACDHWNRLDEDTQILKALGVNQENLTIEWAKIEPEPGHWNWQAVEHYRRELELLKRNHISPIITLQHFALPQWVREKGAWEWPQMPAAFSKFVLFVYTQIAPDVDEFITMNEPMANLIGGYLVGVTPPGNSSHLSNSTPSPEDFQKIVAPLRGMVMAHAAAYRTLHRTANATSKKVRVGIANYAIVLDPASDLNPLDWAAAKILHQTFNWTFLDAVETGKLKIDIPFILNVAEILPDVAGTEDFVGLDYYTRNAVAIRFNPKPSLSLENFPGVPLSIMNWEIYPEGLYRILKEAHERYPNQSLYIAENGIADATDEKRIPFIRDHLREVHRAISDGIPVEGYCHWSYIDNFEWLEGFGPRFGFYSVDYTSQVRTARPSAAYYSKITHSNQLEY